jgi:hypothetical protein
VGLAYKFSNNRVLERIEVENQDKDRFRFQMFEEFRSLKDGEVMISIEHW